MIFLVKLSDDIFVQPNDISIIQNTKYNSSRPFESFEGSEITFRNGMRVYVQDKTPDEIYKTIMTDCGWEI